MLVKTSLAAASVLWMGVLHAQPAANFTVVSIRPSAPETPATFFVPRPGGGLRATYVTVKMLLSYAYGVRDFQISGGTAWMDSERYDIVAKTGSSPDGQLAERIRSMLTERFHAAVQRETQEVPIYALVVAAGGPKLKESAPGRPQGIGASNHQIYFQASPVSALTNPLANSLGRQVIDDTGLTGRFDFGLVGPLEGADSPTVAPFLFAALREQFGLRLESRRGPVAFLVIDHLEKPSEN